MTKIFNILENWRGIYVEEWFNWYFQSVHPKFNSNFGHDLLVNISKFVKSYRVVETERLKRFIVLVEGDSEFEALPSIFKALGVSGLAQSTKFINLKGKDRVQKDKIKDNLQRFKDDDITYFLILDNDENVHQYVDDLKREQLIDDGYYLIWDNKFEDNFAEGAILKILLDLENKVFQEITSEELRKYNSTKHDVVKSIEQLFHDKGMHLNFDSYKVPVAQKLSMWICEEIDESMHDEKGIYDGKRTPTSKSFPDFIVKLRTITERMKTIYKEFHVVQ